MSTDCDRPIKRARPRPHDHPALHAPRLPHAPCAQVSLGRDRVLVEYDIGNSFAATGVVARAAVAHPSIRFALELMTHQPIVLVIAGDAREGAKHLCSAALTE